MALSKENIYALLPAIHRLRDAEGEGVLEDLVAVLAEQSGIMEEDIAAAYRNWFIETCDNWAIPYIADLVGVRTINDLEGLKALPQRAYVANTLAYRRRKGTVPVLEEITRDTTGWIAVAAEFFKDLSVTQHVNHVRAAGPGTAGLRDATRLQLTDGAFDPGPRTGEMRRIADRGGRYNIHNIGLFVWRAEAFVLPFCEARLVTGVPGRWFVDPLRRDLPLANTPETERDIESLAREEHTPGRLRPLALYLELEAQRQAIADGDTQPKPVFMTKEPPFEIWLRATAVDSLERVVDNEIMICHLGDLAVPGDWRRPPANVDYLPSSGGGAVSLPIRIGIDPARGRLALPAGEDAAEVRVTHAYHSPGDLGGGPYDRSDSLRESLDGRAVDWQVMVTHIEAADGITLFATLADAVQAWNALAESLVGVIAVADNAIFEEDLTGVNRIEIGQGSLLVIAAMNWPAIPVEGGAPGETQRPLGLFDASGRRPALLGDVEVHGAAPANSLTPGKLVIDGFLIAGGISVAVAAGEGLGELRLAHLTQKPGAGGVTVSAGNEQLTIDVRRASLGPVSVPGTIRRFAACDAIVDEGAAVAALDINSGETALQYVTLFGDVNVQRIDASNSIFTGPAVAQRLQVGCVRFCYVAADSQLPRRYRCQPDQALKSVSPAEAASVRARIVPSFVSELPARYGYGLLAPLCPDEIAQGSETATAMGAYGFLMQPQRRTNVAVALDEYLGFGLEAGLIEMT